MPNPEYKCATCRAYRDQFRAIFDMWNDSLANDRQEYYRVGVEMAAKCALILRLEDKETYPR